MFPSGGPFPVELCGTVDGMTGVTMEAMGGSTSCQKQRFVLYTHSNYTYTCMYVCMLVLQTSSVCKC